MIFPVGTAHSLVRILLSQEQSADTQARLVEAGGLASLVAKAADAEKENAEGLLLAIERTFAAFDSLAINDRLQRFRFALGYTMTWRDLSSQTKALREIIEAELNHQHFFHYEPAKAKALLASGAEWSGVRVAFPSSAEDINDAMLAYASDLYTSAVFHMMRVAEVGLRELAHERRVTLPKSKPLSHAQWGEIIEAVEKKASEILKSAPAGPGKDEALNFYNGAASHLRALKDKYRNRVMHARERFNQHEAADAIFHCRSFMLELGKRLKESRGKQIKWKF